MARMKPNKLSHRAVVGCFVLLSAVAAGCAKSPEAAPAVAPTGAVTAATPAFKLLSLAEFDALRTSQPKNTFVYDANGAERFKNGHIPGATWVAHDAVKASELPADKTANLVFYCFNPQCSASHQAAESARNLGYNNVFVLTDGIDGWQKSGRPVEAAK